MSMFRQSSVDGVVLGSTCETVIRKKEVSCHNSHIDICINIADQPVIVTVVALRCNKRFSEIVVNDLVQILLFLIFQRRRSPFSDCHSSGLFVNTTVF